MMLRNTPGPTPPRMPARTRITATRIAQSGMFCEYLNSSLSNFASGNSSSGSVTVIWPETSTPPSGRMVAVSMPRSRGAICASTWPDAAELQRAGLGLRHRHADAAGELAVVGRIGKLGVARPEALLVAHRGVAGEAGDQRGVDRHLRLARDVAVDVGDRHLRALQPGDREVDRGGDRELAGLRIAAGELAGAGGTELDADIAGEPDAAVFRQRGGDRAGLHRQRLGEGIGGERHAAGHRAVVDRILPDASFSPGTVRARSPSPENVPSEIEAEAVTSARPR